MIEMAKGRDRNEEEAEKANGASLRKRKWIKAKQTNKHLPFIIHFSAAAAVVVVATFFFYFIRFRILILTVFV